MGESKMQPCLFNSIACLKWVGISYTYSELTKCNNGFLRRSIQLIGTLIKWFFLSRHYLHQNSLHLENNHPSLLVKHRIATYALFLLSSFSLFNVMAVYLSIYVYLLFIPDHPSRHRRLHPGRHHSTRGSNCAPCGTPGCCSPSDGGTPQCGGPPCNPHCPRPSGPCRTDSADREAYTNHSSSPLSFGEW